MNIVALMLVWLMAHKAGEDERRLIGVFFASSVIPLFIPLMFAQPVIGASAGVYGMIGYLLPDLIGVVPLPLSYVSLLPLILFEGCFMCNPWSKLFHIFGLTLGLVFRYMFDVNSIALKKTALQLNLGTDYYSLLSLGYPRGYVEYQKPSKAETIVA